MAIKIEMLRCFAAVARSGNLSDAAESLGRTASAVSMMLKQFESNLGAPLFESDRKNKLTALGRLVFDEATREVERFERAVDNMQSFARSEAGFIRVAAVPSVAVALLPLAVTDFLCDRPGVRIDIRDMDSAGVLHELARERVDIGLATGVGAGAQIVREALFSDAFGVVCRTDHPLVEFDTPLDWNALAKWSFIANGLCSNITDATFKEIFAGAQLTVRNTTSLLALVRAGVGVTVLPRLVIDGNQRELSFLRVKDANARRQIDILRHAHYSPMPAARGFEDALRRAANDVSSTW